MATSQELFERARRVIPGGVDSPVRAYGAVGGVPRFLVRGEGAYVWDADGNRYVDLIGSWGALLFGHARAEIAEAAVEVVGTRVVHAGHRHFVQHLARGADRGLRDFFRSLAFARGIDRAFQARDTGLAIPVDVHVLDVGLLLLHDPREDPLRAGPVHLDLDARIGRLEQLGDLLGAGQGQRRVPDDLAFLLRGVQPRVLRGGGHDHRAERGQCHERNPAHPAHHGAHVWDPILSVETLSIMMTTAPG